MVTIAKKAIVRGAMAIAAAALVFFAVQLVEHNVAFAAGSSCS